MGDDFCKYLYPRPVCPQAQSPRLNLVTERFELTCEIAEEDERLSPYVPEWLLAWGGGMNIQYCSSTHFPSYISKYVTKLLSMED